MAEPRRSTSAPYRAFRVGPPLGTLLLLGLVCAGFMAQVVVDFVARDQMDAPNQLELAGAFSIPQLRLGRWWTMLTFPWLHVGWLHFACVVAALVLVVRELENILGTRVVLIIFSLSALLGGIMHAFLFQGAQVVGSAAGAASLLALYATTFPHMALVTWGALSVRARHLLLVPIGVGVWLLWRDFAGSSTRLSAGGIGIVVGVLSGWFHARMSGLAAPFFFQRWAEERREREARRLVMDADEFIEEEVDPILEKVAAHGMSSLTREEKRLLDLASEKLRRRARSR